jgi:L-aspartate oxidase
VSTAIDHDHCPVQCHVLVLGAGLAGLRAAIAALEHRPRARVLCCALGRGPAASSFANRNQRLGMQVLCDAVEQQAYTARALEIAPPGRVSSDLVDLLAAHSLERFLDLSRLGVPCVGRGAPLSLDARDILDARVPRCFLPEQASAVIIPDLPLAWSRLAGHFQALGGELAEGVRVLDLCRAPESGAIAGALLLLPGASAPCVIRAGAVVLALGGSAPLFERSVAGPWNPGTSLSLLRRAGARIENAGLMQFLWYTLEPPSFLNLARVAREDWEIRGHFRGAEEEVARIPSELRELAEQRAGHCPFAPGQEDAALDLFLAEHMDAEGLVRLRPQGAARWLRAAPMAHAGNGGAWIAPDGSTSVPGLFACGECATGMHGANRIGGGMIAATQVFGALAGAHAVDVSIAGGGSGAAPCASDLLNLPLRAQETTALLRWLATSLQRHCTLGGRPSLAAFAAELDERLHQGLPCQESRLACEAAREIVQGQLAVREAG